MSENRQIHYCCKKGKPQCSLVAGAFGALIFGACSSSSILTETQVSNFKYRHERVTQKQKCIRTGGSVGVKNRHLYNF